MVWTILLLHFILLNLVLLNSLDFLSLLLLFLFIYVRLQEMLDLSQ